MTPCPSQIWYSWAIPTSENLPEVNAPPPSPRQKYRWQIRRKMWSACLSTFNQLFALTAFICSDGRAMVQKSNSEKMGWVGFQDKSGHGCPQAWARGGRKCCRVFLYISSYSNRFGRRIIYALFSQPVVGFQPWTPLGDFHPQTSSLPTPRKNPAGAQVCFWRGEYRANLILC